MNSPLLSGVNVCFKELFTYNLTGSLIFSPSSVNNLPFKSKLLPMKYVLLGLVNVKTLVSRFTSIVTLLDWQGLNTLSPSYTTFSVCGPDESVIVCVIVNLPLVPVLTVLTTVLSIYNFIGAFLITVFLVSLFKTPVMVNASLYVICGILTLFKLVSNFNTVKLNSDVVS